MSNNSINKYVTFMLENTKFGISVLQTKEIVEYGNVTPVPEAPDYIDGVINIRGGVIPVVDLMERFFKKKEVITEKTGVVIVEIKNDDGTVMLLGLVVDCVNDVLEIKNDNLEPPPKYGSAIKTDYIKNVASLEDGFVLLLDINKVFSGDEIIIDSEITESNMAKV